MENTGINIGIVKSYSDSIVSIINQTLVPALIAIAFIVFLWGIYKYFIADTSDLEKKEGKQFAMWGIIGFVIIFSVWALVAIVTDTFKLGGSSQNTPKPPVFNTDGK